MWRCSHKHLQHLSLSSLSSAQIQSLTSKGLVRSAVKDHFLFAHMPKLQGTIDEFFSVRVKAGEFVFRQGDAADNLYVLAEGRLERLVGHDAPAVEEEGSPLPKVDAHAKLVRTLRRGAVFGDLEMGFDEPRGASVRAATDCTLWALGHMQLQNQDHGLMRKIFDRHASVEHEGHRFMTAADFFAAIKVLDGTDGAPASFPGPDNKQKKQHFWQGRRTRDDRAQARVRRQREEMTMQLVDASGNKLIDFMEFLRFDVLMNQVDAAHEVVFRLADRDRDGLL